MMKQLLEIVAKEILSAVPGSVLEYSESRSGSDMCWTVTLVRKSVSVIYTPSTKWYDGNDLIVQHYEVVDIAYNDCDQSVAYTGELCLYSEEIIEQTIKDAANWLIAKSTWPYVC